MVNLFRREIFEAVAKSDLDGMIFTYVWALDQQEDWDFVDKICDTIESRGGKVCLVELEANIEERLERNKSPHRLEHKPTKRNIDESEHHLKATVDEFRLNLLDGEIKRENYMKINNTNLSAEKIANIIKEQFEL